MSKGHTISTLKSRISLVLRRFHISLGLYSLPNWYKLSLRRSSTLRISALLSSFLLILLASAIIIPIYNNVDITEAATGTAKESSLSFNLTNSTASVDLSVNDINGTFASSSDDNSKVKFNISTTNYTGYTLSIKGINNNQTLVNGTNGSYTLSSISTATESFNSTDYNNKWGYLPSKLNSSTNTSYLPAPTATASTLDKTTTANSTANTYTIGIGARASYTTPAGEYTGTYILTAVANNIAYYIAFNDNTNDSTVTNLPTAISSSVSTTSITLPSTTPTRTGYTFRSWCLGTVSNNGTTCTGTQYNKSSSFGLDQTTTNGTSTAPVNLYAVWTINTYNLVVTGDSYLSSMTIKQGSTSGTTINGTKSGNTVTFSNLTYGISYYLYPVFTSGYEFSSYTKTDSATGAVLGSTSAVNTYYTMGAGNGAVKVTSEASIVTIANATYMQDVNSCPSTLTTGTQYTLKDNRDNTSYKVAKLADGKCWMLENLAIDLTNSTVLSGMNASNTHATATVLNYLKNGGGSGQYPASGVSSAWTSSSQNSYNLPYMVKSGTCNTSGKYCVTNTAGGNWSYTDTTEKANDGADKYPGKVGIYYNYCAASAGSYCYSSAPANTNAQYDICPYGWRLPTGGSSGEFQALYTAYSSNYANFRSALQVPLSGHFYNGVAHNQGGGGYFWSSTYFNASLMYRLSVNTSNVAPANTDTRNNGSSVRCVLGS